MANPIPKNGKPRPTLQPVARLRLVKVVVQPVFVLDDGTHLQEVNAEPVAVLAQDWPAWAKTAYDEETLTLLAHQVQQSPGQQNGDSA